MRITFTLIALALASGVLAQEKSPDAVWKWVDKDGITHYSDQPGPGAVKVDLRIQTYSPPDTPASAPPTKKSTASAVAPYTSIAIVSPAADATVQAAEGPVNVSVRVEPALESSHRIRLELDGQPQGEPAASLNFAFGEMTRGAHSVRASVVAANGSVVIQSATVTFYVQQTSTLAPTRKR